MSSRDRNVVRARLVAVALAGGLLVAPAIFAVGGLDGPNQPLGFVPGMPYAGGEYGGIDSISTYSGALVQGLPIGQGFRVGASGLSYGFTLFYNSNVWSYEEGVDENQPGGFVKATINKEFNAGVGWTLSLGHLLKPEQNPSKQWVYMGPDGSSHKFFDELHTDDADSNKSPYVRYTRDGSYLRLITTSASFPVVQFPNGFSHVFNSDGRLVTMRDAYKDASGNYLNTVTVTYPNNTTWQIQDSEGRLHRVTFDSNFANGGKVTGVELQAYGSTPGLRQTATYSLSYDWTPIRRTCQDTWWGNDLAPQNGSTEEAMVNVPLLRLVTGPTEEPDTDKRVKWIMGPQNGATYHEGAPRSSQEQCHFAGVIEELELPTHGKVIWDWQRWYFPATGVAYVDSSPGVSQRTILNGQADWTYATWTYTSNVEDAGVKTSVRDPDNNVTKYYFYAPANAQLPWDYSLPIKNSVVDNQGRHLSQELISGAPGNPTVRQTWLKFAHDTLTGMGGNDQILSNRRVVSSKIVYMDDPGPYKETITTFSDFDGLGHYRQVTTTGNFDLGSNSRTNRVQWNDGRGCYSECGGASTYVPVPTSTPWVLGTFIYTQQSEGGDVATQEYTFESVPVVTGFLSQRRVLVSQSGQSENDVLVQYCRDSKGYLISERYYGGDTNTLGDKAINCLAGSDSTYRLDYEYQSGVRSKATYKTPAGASLGFNNFVIPSGGVDATTGLVKSWCDSAGYCTEADYDRLGRVVQQRGAASAGTLRGATVNYAYTYLAGLWEGWKVTTTLACPLGLTCPQDEVDGYPESAVHYDSFGRPFKTDRTNADGTSSKSYTKYGKRGMVVFSSEWTAGPIVTGNEPGTTYSNFDVFGRARTVTAPDGHVSTAAYTGDRIVSSTVQIASGAFPPSGPPPEVASTREEHYDMFGRLVRVREPAGTNGALVNTDLTYDIGGRLTQIAQISQVRTYTYDRRGFLKSETIPEYGTSGNGTRYRCSFDALGNAWKTREVPCGQTATAGVAVTYDYATRLTSVSEEGARLLKQYVYDSATGRLQTAKAFNYLPEAGYTTFEVDETYAFGGIGGAVSSRTTEIFANGLPQEQFTTGITLDRAGQVRSLLYPSCTGGFCGSPGPTGRTVDYRYARGFLSKIPGFIDTPISYHANGLFAQVWRTNGMRIDQSIDTTTMMQRPLAMTVRDSAGVAQYAPSFQFDGAGNIKATGPDKLYRYDAVSRLVESRETWGGTTYVQKPTFDAFGNIQALETGPMNGAQTLQTTTSATTNRLTTAGTTYDLSGNMTIWAGGPRYDYDRLNRMRRFRGSTLPGAEEWVFAYTADDERILSKRVAGGGSLWTVRGLDNQVLRAWRADVSANSFRDYVWTGRDLVARVERVPSGGSWTETTIHAAVNHLGTPTVYTDAMGFRITSHLYYPFGKELTTSQDDERMKYTGHERDLWNTSQTDDDLDYMHARHYNPQLARFLQVDPLVGSARRPQSLNRYAYVAGNPMSFVDPSGRLVITVIGKDPCPMVNPNLPCPPSLDVGVGSRDSGGHGDGWLIDPEARAGNPNGDGELDFPEDPPPPPKTCQGVARGLAGNNRLIGRHGSFSEVEANTAAIIPRQFGFATDRQGRSAMMPYVSEISGQLTGSVNGQVRTSHFTAVTDVIGGESPIPGVSARDALMQLFPGQLIVEVTGGIDVGGGAQITLEIPGDLECPEGTREVH